MKPENVAHYLRKNPQFFVEYAEMLADVRIPHPYENRVISINERQMVSLREKNRLLQEKLHELISIGENNDMIGEKMHQLSVALMESNSLEEMLNRLNDSLRENFSIQQVIVRLWFLKDSPDNQQRPEFTPVSEAVRTAVESMAKPYCGPHLTDEIKQWFGDETPQLQSFSLIPLRRKHTFGLLVMGSPELERFYPDMGTLYLERLSELIAGALIRLGCWNIEAQVHELPRS
ncbi:MULTISPECIES: DUF484 family protein [Nitrosomonas]|uniref:3'-5'-bisphosphate nucleotidase n=1 Tax=Nitrosomonas communis TaxID=44574 RepID=A0A0F7KBP9_9PROT|nr:MULTISPECIES: DUF484 family protein [Nitrosomonas]AKH37855.1 3'-5'-bisphosphate nucleotidase [Nitrosomonas communis]TYP92869.1 hypothetical protein BCL69_100568 [Nitrosomonas communis]UVS63207.1 DUF484 family protein [Nitrosomonas sp. PLL12]